MSWRDTWSVSEATSTLQRCNGGWWGQWSEEELWVSGSGSGARCIRDLPSTHLLTERHCLFSQCLSLACSARLYNNSVCSRSPERSLRSSCPVNRTSRLDGGRGRPFIYFQLCLKRRRETLLIQWVYYDLWLLLACVWGQFQRTGIRI